MIVGNFTDWSVGALSFVASSTSDTATITLPAGIQSGDLIVLVDTAFSTSLTAPAAVFPAGFTTVSQATLVRDNAVFNDYATRIIASMKIGSPADSSAVVTGMAGLLSTPNFMGKVALVFRAAAGIRLAATSPQIEATVGDPAAQVVAAGLERSVVVAAYAAGTVLNSVSFSPAPDGTLNVNNVLQVSYKIFNGPGAAVTADLGPSANVIADLFTCRFDPSL